MGWQIIKQPDKRYAIWSSIVDNFVYINCTREQVIEAFIRAGVKRIINDITPLIGKIDKEEKAYYQFTKTWDEALEWVEVVHGKRALNKLLKDLKTIGNDKKGGC